MSEKLPSLRLLRITKVVAQTAAWVLAFMAGASALVLFFHLNQPDGETIPYLMDLEARVGAGFWSVVAVTFIISVIGSLVCFVVAPLQTPLYQMREQDELFRVAEQLVPGAVSMLHDDIIKRCANITVFERLVRRLEAEAPKVRRECIELTALVSVLAYREVEPLEAETASLLSLVEQHEAMATTSYYTVTAARDTLTQLAPRIRQILDGHGDVSTQAR